jgi:hypothetical protein
MELLFGLTVINHLLASYFEDYVFNSQSRTQLSLLKCYSFFQYVYTNVWIVFYSTFSYISIVIATESIKYDFLLLQSL